MAAPDAPARSRCCRPAGTLAEASLQLLAALASVVTPATGREVIGPDRNGTRPELPRETVDTGLPAVTGRTIQVPAGGDLASALEQARPGDAISLQAGATFEGPFVLPRKSGSGWIVVRTSASDDGLSPPGTRIGPGDAGRMPKLVAGSGSVVTAAPGAHHFRFVGIEVRPKPGAFLHNLVLLGAQETGPEAIPHHIVFDRCYLHGDAARGTRRGIAMNSAHTAVVDSYLSDFKEVGADSQAIAGWAGPGPYAIVDNYLEGAGENVMFGGADPSIRGLVPSDIEIRRNYFSKPERWNAEDPAFEGTAWTVKNLLELKNARRVLVDGNVFERNWAQAQSGFAILFTVRNQDGTAPWSVVEDVTFSRNLVRHAGSGINILGRDDVGGPSERTKRIVIRNNLFLDIGGPRWGGKGTLFQLLQGTADVVIEHNTALQTGSIVFAEGEPHTGFVFRDNIAPHNEFGIAGTGTAPGLPSLTRYFPGAVVRENVIAGGRPDRYPKGNSFPASMEAIGPAGTDAEPARPAPSNARRKTEGGNDAGVDYADLLAGLGMDRLPAGTVSLPAGRRKASGESAAAPPR